jgi:pimeloyl-ACP methyl ester carboxylesterase
VARRLFSFPPRIGATIALDLAAVRPHLVRAVVAHESPWHVTRYPPTPRQIRALTTMSWLSARGRHADAAEAFLRFAYGYRDGGTAWDGFPEAWRRAVADNARAALVDIRTAIGRYPPAKSLAAIRVPVICTCGDRSATTIVRVTRRLAGLVPTATVRVVQGAGHAVSFDAPEGFAAILTEALTLN